MVSTRPTLEIQSKTPQKQENAASEISHPARRHFFPSKKFSSEILINFLTLLGKRKGTGSNGGAIEWREEW